MIEYTLLRSAMREGGLAFFQERLDALVRVVRREAR
jgi:hypothetical protein